MFSNYFKSAWRNLLANRLYSSITILGLSIGLAVGLLVVLWVQDENSFDRFHPKIGQIYRVGIDGGGTGDNKQIFSEIIAPVTTYAKKELPEVIDGVRIMNAGSSPLFTYKEKKIKEDNMVGMTDPSFFTMFDFPLIKGDSKNPFPQVYSLVLTESTAKKYFGNEEPIGKVITGDGKDQYTITGVIADFPANSSIRFNMLVPVALFNKIRYVDNATSYNGTARIPSIDEDWINFGYDVYLQVKPGTNLEMLSKKLRAIHERNKPDDAPVPYLVRNMADMHLTTIDGQDAGLSTVKIFSIVALVILLIASINYVNLSTARSLIRSKEMSLRKIAGAQRWQLFFQIIVETAIVFAVATIIAGIIIYLAMPVYNHFSGKQLVFSLTDSRLWITVGVTLIATLVASSIYPAILLSSFDPLKSLRGKVTTSIGTGAFRKMLVVAQFAFSFLLISGTLIISRQLDFVQKNNPGYNRENVLMLRFPFLDRHYEAIRADLMKNPAVADVTRSGMNIVFTNGWTGDTDYDGKTTGTTLYLHPMAIDEHFLDFYGIRMKEGNNFSGARMDSARFILNETAVREMGLKDPIGKRLRIQKTNGTISGVVKDFHYMSMRKKIEPAVFIYSPQQGWQLSVKVKPGHAHDAVAATEKMFKQFHPDLPFEYSFLDDTFTQIYTDDKRTGSLFAVFAFIAVFISCLGLFGLATYTAQVKTREVGIRKVLGASISGIVALLSKEFLKLVLIGMFIAMPFAWYAINDWLQDYAYRITVPWDVFILSGIISLGIAIAAVSVRTLQAALANPVKSIKSE